MGKEPYTVAGLAKSIASPKQSEVEIIRMLRHYSGEALLMPTGDVNTGTGRARLYPNDAPLRAAILLRLNQFGVPIGVLKRAFKNFDLYLSAEFSTTDLVAASKSLTAPCLFVMAPEDGASKPQRYVHLREISDFEKLAKTPLIVIPLLPIIGSIKEPTSLIRLNPKKRIIRLNR